jgi:hypothetical protein
LTSQLVLASVLAPRFFFLHLALALIQLGDHDPVLSLWRERYEDSLRSHSFGRLFDRRWIVIVVIDDARTMTLGTGDDVAVPILDSALAMTLRTDFHVA